MVEKQQPSFHTTLRELMDGYVHRVYDCTQRFPKEELFGVTSQLRRSALSVVLNYVEGYARMKQRVHKQFLEMSYGSLKESKYLIEFSYKRGYLPQSSRDELLRVSEQIGAMLWGIIGKLK